MTDRETFLRAICADPADDTARLVFADWLEEHGEAARGEFIRVEVALAHRIPEDEADGTRRAALFARRAELLNRHRREWLEPFVGYAKAASFDRGFVRELDVPAHAFLAHGEQWLAITPLTRVRFTTCHMWDEEVQRYTSQIETLFASPLLSRLEKIDLERNQVSAMELTYLAAHADLPRLRHLILRNNRVGSEGAMMLAAMPQLRRLKELDLVGNGITNAGGRALAQSPYLGELKELWITKNPIHGKAWTLLEQRFGTALVG
jgi:uncharacterized protein (TIGR02996 family)